MIELTSPPLIALLCLLCLLALSVEGLAEERALGHQEEEEPTIEAIFSAHGLYPEQEKGCLDFRDASALRARQERWHEAILTLNAHHPEALHTWLTGLAPPPELVLQEAITQRDCLFGALISEAAEEHSALLLDYASSGQPATKPAMQRAAERYALSASMRRAVSRRFSLSHHRDAASQALIWRRKFAFSYPRSFDLISSHAAERCGLEAGQPWRPHSSSHSRCWTRHLNQEERQREILTASSAPGISRHHWGTEFDLYGLDPRRFLAGHDLHDEYLWMSEHALKHGFFQPFTGPDELGEHSYIEERWHWSYSPIAEALTRYIEDHQSAYESALEALWIDLEARWSGGARFKEGEPLAHFSFVQSHWRDYVLHTARVALSRLPHTPWLPPSSALRFATLG